MKYFEPIKATLLNQRKEVTERIKHLEMEETDLVRELEDADELGTLAWQSEVVSTRAVVKQHSLRLLKEIEQSLLRLEKGTYGTCRRCLGKISHSRLKVIPTTQICEMCI